MEDRRLFRRNFLGKMAILGAAGAAASAKPLAAAVNGSEGECRLPEYACAQDYRSLKQSSYNHTGGNSDRWPIAPGATKEVFSSDGPGVITHIWFTIAARSRFHLKEIVLRMYWDGASKPSVEVPVGDFFGLNLGEYYLYQSAFLNCSSVQALNCYFAMPFRKSARVTVTNEGSGRSIPSTRISTTRWFRLFLNEPYFHAQYRQATPKRRQYASGEKELNPDGKKNYVFAETRGRGHLMGVTLGVLQNKDDWMGEGDEMIFIDDERSQHQWHRIGRLFLRRLGLRRPRRRNTLREFVQWRASDQAAELAGGRYCLYRWHADNPVTFRKYLKYTIEHGHANDRGDCFYSVAYWYQTEPFTDFPPLAPVADRSPVPKT